MFCVLLLNRYRGVCERVGGGVAFNALVILACELSVEIEEKFDPLLAEFIEAQ